MTDPTKPSPAGKILSAGQWEIHLSSMLDKIRRGYKFDEHMRALAQHDKALRRDRRADLIEKILAFLPDNSPCKFPETGYSIADDVRDHVADGEKWRLAFANVVIQRDALRAELEAASHQLESDRTVVADCITKANRAINSRYWLTEGRGSYEWNDDRWHEEFHQAAVEIKTTFAPMTRIAAEWSLCPKTSAEVIQARRDLHKELQAAAERERDMQERLAGLVEASELILRTIGGRHDFYFRDDGFKPLKNALTRAKAALQAPAEPSGKDGGGGE